MYQCSREGPVDGKERSFNAADKRERNSDRHAEQYIWLGWTERSFDLAITARGLKTTGTRSLAAMLRWKLKQTATCIWRCEIRLTRRQGLLSVKCHACPCGLAFANRFLVGRGRDCLCTSNRQENSRSTTRRLSL